MFAGLGKLFSQLWAPVSRLLDQYGEPIGSATAILVALVVISVPFFASRSPLWREAFRRVRREPMAMVALVVMALFGLVGCLDSIVLPHPKNTPPKTIIDRLFERPREYTYSAPGAKTTTGEPHPRPLKERHILGTDGLGEDVFYRTLKGARTAILIGGLTQLIVTPLALLFGMTSGYFGKAVDDIVQYIYTTLSSVPDILLLIAIRLALGGGLIQVCVALGVTSWVGLCRLSRGETLKHRDREYVRAARALGLSHRQILTRHILPNLFPLVIITATLGFSGLVLSEAILSYLGIGVEGIGSWGNMIDAARIELAREPIIWWNLASASTALFILVLAFNIFGDAIRDAIDPRLRSS
jgi:peptide/nickel transport system permease protein